MPRIFVGIPTRDRPALVREAVGSVLAQTFGDFRVVVSDNASSPAAAESVRAYVESLHDARVSFVRQRSNVGEYGQGRYFFARSAECEFLAILHDDDVLRPEYFARAVAALAPRPALAYFVANPRILDAQGNESAEGTARYLSRHGRTAMREGEIDVLHALLFHDFTPISATFFRRASLEDSGFVDDDCFGLYPFEPNIFLRLGDRGARAWFCAEPLMGIRFHEGAIRSRFDPLGTLHMVETMMALMQKRRYLGRYEVRRRRFLGRLHRARTLAFLKAGEIGKARKAMREALRAAPSLKSSLVAPFVMAAPGLVRRFLSPPAAQFSEQELADFRREPIAD